MTLGDGRTVRRHIDHIRFRSSAATPDDSSGSDDLVAYLSTEPVPATGTINPPFVNPYLGGLLELAPNLIVMVTKLLFWKCFIPIGRRNSNVVTWPFVIFMSIWFSYHACSVLVPGLLVVLLFFCYSAPFCTCSYSSNRVCIGSCNYSYIMIFEI